MDDKPSSKENQPIPKNTKALQITKKIETVVHSET